LIFPKAKVCFVVTGVVFVRRQNPQVANWAVLRREYNSLLRFQEMKDNSKGGTPQMPVSRITPPLYAMPPKSLVSPPQIMDIPERASSGEHSKQTLTSLS